MEVEVKPSTSRRGNKRGSTRLDYHIPSKIRALNSKKCAGKIKNITVTNFMCHDNLTFDLGERINFLSGKNGSGKSAILTAVVLALGGRTSDTNRGQSLKCLIKTGQLKCAISITLCNEGALSFKPDVYGRTITVTRTFTENSSGYKILASNGKQMNLNRHELDSMLLAFNIQVKNPVCILNQDTARSFLKSASATDLYKLFYQGCLFTELDEKIHEMKTSIGKYEKFYHDKQRDIQESVEDLTAYEEKIKLAMEIKELTDKIFALNGVVVWANVRDYEVKLESIEEKISTSRKAIEANSSFSNAGTDRQKMLTSEIRELEEQISILSTEVEAEEYKNVNNEQKYSNLKELTKKAFIESSKLEKKIAIEDQRCNKIKAEIENYSRQSSQMEEKRTQIERQKGELAQRMVELKATLSTTQVHREQLENTYENVSNKFSSNQRLIRNYEININEKEKRVQHLLKNSDQLNIYGEWVPRLITIIDECFNKRMFEEKPRGPLARYIKLKDNTWGPAVESVISKRTLLSFVVNSTNDYHVLNKIIERLGIQPKHRPMIQISKFHNTVHDVRRTQTTHPNYYNLWQLLEVSDAVVANIIIDTTEPDTTLLIPTSDEAYPLMEYISNVPPKCVKAITKNGDMFFPQPNYRIYSSNLPRNTELLQTSSDVVIQSLKAEISQLNDELNNCKQNNQMLHAEELEAKKKLEQAHKEATKIRKIISNCEEKQAQLEGQEEPLNVNVDILYEDLRYIERMKKQYMEQLEVLNNSKLQKEQELREMKAHRNEFTTKRDALNQQIQTKEADLNKLKSEVSEYESNRNTYQELIAANLKNLKILEEKKISFQADLNRCMSNAMRNYPDRPELPNDVEAVEREVLKITSHCKRLEEELGGEPVEPYRYRERITSFKSDIKEIKTVKILRQQLEDKVKELETQTARVLQLTSEGVRQKFKSIIGLRKFTGNLHFDHVNKKLSVEIKSDPTCSSNSVITTLSGGERSFSMVSLILALWSRMSTPFYFLDEFDDEVNRRLIIDLLIEHARSSPDKQFVFLTPHSTSDKDEEGVQYFKMTDPRK